MTTRKKSTQKAGAAKSFGNILTHLKWDDTEQELLKTRFTIQIHQILHERGLTQKEAGKVLGIAQSQVSALARNRAGNFSVGRLMEFLTLLGQDIKITVTPAGKERGEISVV
ncbi:MAG TPA: helix-turn-helix transcriptional regulator [Candidatus Angelobacter sp.]|nr:helix-turn-helix transcriptional regulator [Candidatus Angelobacter sp.]